MKAYKETFEIYLYNSYNRYKSQQKKREGKK